MRSFRPLAATFLFAGSLLALLSGCGGSDNDQPEIVFWTTEGYQPKEMALLKDLAQRFEEQTGTRVKMEFFTWEEINSKYLAALAAGKPPTIGQHGPDLPLRFGAEGNVVPMDELVAELGHDRFYDEFLDKACKYKNHYWSLPWFIEVRGLLIRTDWLAEINATPPTTWDEWLTVAKGMTRDLDNDGTLDRYGFGLYGRDDFGQAWVAMAAQLGGGLFDKEGNIKVLRPENIAAVEWYTNLYLKHGVTPPGTKSATWTDMNAYYKQGLVGMLITNGYMLHEMQRDAPDVMKVSRFVPMPVPEPGAKSISFLGGSHLMVFKDAPHQEQAFAFLRFLMQADNYLAFLKSTDGGTLPVLKDVAQQPYFQDNPNLRVLVDQIRHSVRFSHPGPVHPAVGAAEGEHVYGRVIQEVLAERMTAAEALAAAEAETKRIFEQQQVQGGDN
jgi:ABC-type glycerol-3-phosphate transport system substrate-binding protein